VHIVAWEAVCQRNNAILRLDGEQGHTLIKCWGLGINMWYLHMSVQDCSLKSKNKVAQVLFEVVVASV